MTRRLPDEAPMLVGQFVTLRPLAPSDAAVTHAWRLGDRARHLNGGAASVEDQARWIASRPNGEFNYMIELKDGRQIGMLSLLSIDLANRRAESARFLIGDEEAARGVPAAVEAMSLIYELAFDRLGLERVHGVIEESNHLMVKWQKYLGMREEGRFRRHFLMEGQFRDAIALSLLADEYRAVALPRMRMLMRLGAAAA
ncbi:MAG TPA: GNAT family N-acetyltransferase [Caulobacteraceae bacterium]|nr:GNAT family N-acetyltransferase [Caulobacteraceae bacterium]